MKEAIGKRVILINDLSLPIEECSGRRVNIIRCFNCHKFGRHIERLCSNKAICGNCSGGHHTRDCTDSNGELTCPNCSGKHKASSDTCPTFQEYKKALIEKHQLIIRYD